MSKKKKSREGMILKEVDNTLDHTYDDLQKEIENMQNRLIMADQKARKKAKKAMKKNKHIKPEEIEIIKANARKEILGEIESNNLLDRVSNVLSDIAPIIVVIARLIASLICAILSMDIVKTTISKDTMAKLDKVYKSAMTVSM